MAYEYEQNNIENLEREFAELRRQVLTEIQAYSREAGALITAMREFAQKNRDVLMIGAADVL